MTKRESGTDGSEERGSTPRFPKTERAEPPLYLARYLARQAGRGPRTAADDNGAGDDGLPLYLRRFRERARTGPPEAAPLWQRSPHGIQQALSEDNLNKEISAPPEARPRIVNEIYLVRHAETQGYSTESGLTPLGVWQSHTYGHNLAKRVRSGETIVVVHADTNRARETAENLHRGLLDGVVMFEKDVEVLEPRAMPEFRNFQVATPDGLRDPTAAFRRYYAVLEKFERMALGDRPMWLVEMDRFWRTQQGGSDPIQFWLTVPLLHFEPPSFCVRRFWKGLRQLADAHPGARLVIASHSGPIRAFAVWAFGYDPGEPYNTEHVRVKLMEGGQEALVSYRNRVQEVHVPPLDELPAWEDVIRKEVTATSSVTGAEERNQT
jgi:broad specificity phosphatase PhoE